MLQEMQAAAHATGRQSRDLCGPGRTIRASTPSEKSLFPAEQALIVRVLFNRVTVSRAAPADLP